MTRKSKVRFRLGRGARLTGVCAQGSVKFTCNFFNTSANTVVVSTFNDDDALCLIPYEEISIAPMHSGVATALHHPSQRTSGIKFRASTTVPGRGNKRTDVRLTGDPPPRFGSGRSDGRLEFLFGVELNQDDVDTWA